MTGLPLKTIACLPTYNESRTIATAAGQILNQMPITLILGTDDSSPDGTGAIADQLARQAHPGKGFASPS